MIALRIVSILVIAGVVAWLGPVLYGWISPTTAQDRISLVAAIAQFLGGAVLLFGLYFTYQTVRNSQKTLEHQRETLDQQRKNQQDERFFKAAELLGNEKSESARIGALYALERLARDSDDYYHQVIEVVCAFIRRQSQECRPDTTVLDRDHLPKTSNEIAAAMTILKRRSKKLGDGEDEGLDLEGANLCGVRLKGADFDHANFRNALLIGTIIEDCNFAEGNFYNADLRYAMFSNTILVDSMFFIADVRRAVFSFLPQLPDPSSRFAISTAEGTTPFMTISYSREPQVSRTEVVEGGRYLDRSVWAGADMRGAAFMCLDLSGMRVLTEDQYDSIRRFPEEPTKPMLISREEAQRLADDYRRTQEPANEGS